MVSPAKTAKSIFLEAVDKYEPSQWESYVNGACGDDEDLRLRVDNLLRAHQEADSLLDNIDGTVDFPKLDCGPGTVIDNYKLLQQIGEGGFGVVFMAEQQQPVKRKVALKVIKPGMDTKAVVARFEAERQALAMMDHANIARVYDGGATESGRPFFVMELVKGVPLTDYCDKNELPTAERLELFVDVCDAVQHAHLKGIIHRDLKPSNILVTLHDGQPVIKVIDFGVSKAVNQQLTEKTLFTAFGQMVGTPQYMSPEQAEMSGLDVDTRSDIYSLGVLLYELLTGTTPLEGERLRNAGYVEMQRMIQEDDPPIPSTRLSTSGDQLTSIAKHRSISPERLSALVRGDLDWIVMKALEKDRSRRYETANNLADDIKRFKREEPIVARPPTNWYRFSKFVRRNKAPVAVGLAFAFVVTCSIVGMTFALLWWIEAARETSDQLAKNQTLVEKNKKVINEKQSLIDENNKVIKDKQALIDENKRVIKEKESLIEENRKVINEKERLLDDYRTDLVEKALFFALSGDIESSRDVATQLDDLDCPKSQINTILGVAEFYSGKMKEAEQKIRAAYEADKSNVAAASMLFVAQTYVNERNKADKLLATAVALEPRQGLEYFDKFFQGYAVMWSYPDRARKIFKDLLEERSSPLVTAFYAVATAEIGSYVATKEEAKAMVADMKQALSDVNAARRASPQTFIIDLADLYVHLTTMEIRKLAGLSNWRELSLTAEPIAKRVIAGKSLVGHGVAAYYYELLNNVDKAEAVYQKVVELKGAEVQLACLQFSKGNDLGWKAISQATIENPNTYLARMLIHAIRDGALPEGESLEKMVSHFRDTRYVTDVLQVALALKERKACRDIAQALLKNGLPEFFNVGIELRFMETRLKHLEMKDDVDEQWLLSKVVNGRDLNESHFQLAMLCWARGDKKGFKEHLNKVVSLKNYWDSEFHWSRALLTVVE